MSRLSKLLFPSTPRDFPARREVKIGLRAVHVLCAGIFVGSYVLEVANEARGPWLWGTLATGLALLLLDLHESFAIFLQVRGLIVLSKLLLLATLPYWHPWQAWVLCLIVLVSVVSSHAPSRIRYFMLLGRGRIRGAESKG